MSGQAANSFSAVDSRDLDHYRAQPGNWNVQATQLGRGEFRSRIRSVCWSDITLYDNRWGAASLIRGQAPDDWLMLGAATAVSDSISWCGKAVDERLFACTSPGKTIEFRVPDNAHDVIVLIKPRLLRDTCGERAQALIDSAQHVIVPEVAAGKLLNTALGALRCYSAQPQLLDSQAHAGDSRARLLRALEDCFAQPEADLPGPKRGRREAAVHLALEYVSKRIPSCSAMEMAQAAGVSQKTLEQAFRAQLGVTPGRYLKIARLNAAHQRLTDGEFPDTTVTDIALDCGFSHPGRFSSEYQQVFAETPLQTLKRQN